MKHLLSALIALTILSACGRQAVPIVAPSLKCSQSVVFQVSNGGDGLSHLVNYTLNPDGTCTITSDTNVGCSELSSGTGYFITSPGQGQPFSFNDDSCSLN